MGKKLKAVEPSLEIQEQMRAFLGAEGSQEIDAATVAPTHWLWMAEQAAQAGEIAALRTLEANITGKAFQKSLRGIFHKLRSRGVAIDASQHRKSFSIARETKIEYSGLASVSTMEGHHFGTIMRHVPGQRTLLLMLRHLDEGLSLDVMWASRSEGRQVMRDMRTGVAEHVTWHPIPGSYAEHMMYTFLREFHAQNGHLDDTIMEVMTSVGKLPDLPEEHPVIAALAAHGTALPTSVGTSGDLLEDPFFQTLLPDEHLMKSCLAGLQEITESPLVLPGYQVTERLRERVDTLIDGLVDDAGHARVVRGLFHTAFLATTQDRHAEAAVLTRVAQLIKEGEPARQIPLFVAMFQPALSMVQSTFLSEGRSGLL